MFVPIFEENGMFTLGPVFCPVNFRLDGSFAYNLKDFVIRSSNVNKFTGFFFRVFYNTKRFLYQ